MSKINSVEDIRIEVKKMLIEISRQKEILLTKTATSHNNPYDIGWNDGQRWVYATVFHWLENLLTDSREFALKESISESEAIEHRIFSEKLGGGYE